MKSLRSLLLITSAFALTQCATETAAPSAAAPAPAAASADGEIKPGMTKAQVIAVWNEPDSKTSLPGGGEVWKWAGKGW